MTFVHLEAILKILKDNQRFIMVGCSGSSEDINLDKDDERWRKLKDYYKPGRLEYWQF